jgi:general secretion pathway protein K
VRAGVGERAGGDRGFALLLVLWALVPLSLLFLALVATARSEAQSAANVREAAALEARADGAIHGAIFALLVRGDEAAAPVLPESGVAVSVADLGGRVNPNTASPELLRALLVQLGATPARAQDIAAAIVDWRTPGQRARPHGARAAEYRAAGLDYGPPGAPFETLDEVGLVLGVDPGLLAALLPCLTLDADGPPDPRTAGPVVRRALRDVGAYRSPGGVDGRVVEITAVATGPAGARAVRRATVSVGEPSPSGRDWRVLAWGTVSGP